MALSSDEMSRLQQACEQLDDGPDYRCEDYVANLLNMTLDFQMNTKTVDAAANFFKQRHGVTTHYELKSLLARHANTKEGNQLLAQFLWYNNHWSRAKFLRKIMECLEARGITDQTSLTHWVHDADFGQDVKGQFRTEEHSIGQTLFQWLRLRCGINTVKPDVHVRRFVSNAIGRKPTPKETVAR